jgi:argininosuccinate synthase
VERNRSTPRHRVVLAYSGSLEASAAIPWLSASCDADVVALILDVGQEEPVEPLRARALACGAVRAHVIDARDEFARDYVVPSLHAGAGGGEPSVAALVRPLVARKLAEVAAIEGAAAVAHASTDERFHAAVAAQVPGLPTLAPAREWGMTAAELGEYLRAGGVSFVPPAARDAGDRHLLVRPSADPARAPEGEARLELAFRNHVPVAVNGVPMSASELIESLSLIAGQYGVGWRDACHAPAALILHSAYGALQDSAGVVTVRVSRGEHVVLASESRVVNVA